MTRNAACLCVDGNMLTPALLVAAALRKSQLRSSCTFDVIVFAGPDDIRADHKAWAADHGITISADLPLSQVSDIALQQDRLSPMTLARLLLPDHLAGRYDHILYLDADIAIRGNVAPIFSLDTGAAVLAAAPAARFWEGSMSRRAASLDHFRALGMTEPFRYFNSGVLYIDAGKWNEREIGRHTLAFIRSNPALCILPDEDGLNAVLDGQIAELSPVWNMRGRAWVHGRARSAVRPVVVHFDGPAKPWTRSAGEPPPFRRLRRCYRRHLAQTPWRDWIADDDGGEAGMALQGNPVLPPEEQAYLDAFIRYSASHAFADVEQDIVTRKGGRLRLNERTEARTP